MLKTVNISSFMFIPMITAWIVFMFCITNYYRDDLKKTGKIAFYSMTLPVIASTMFYISKAFDSVNIYISAAIGGIIIMLMINLVRIMVTMQYGHSISSTKQFYWKYIYYILALVSVIGTFIDTIFSCAEVYMYATGNGDAAVAFYPVSDAGSLIGSTFIAIMELLNVLIIYILSLSEGLSNTDSIFNALKDRGTRFQILTLFIFCVKFTVRYMPPSNILPAMASFHMTIAIMEMLALVGQFVPKIGEGDSKSKSTNVKTSIIPKSSNVKNIATKNEEDKKD